MDSNVTVTDASWASSFLQTWAPGVSLPLILIFLIIFMIFVIRQGFIDLKREHLEQLIELADIDDDEDPGFLAIYVRAVIHIMLLIIMGTRRVFLRQEVDDPEDDLKITAKSQQIASELRAATTQTHGGYNGVNKQKRRSYLFAKELGEELCIVCHDTFHTREHLTILPCRHRFHASCCSEWLEHCHGPARCPICARAVGSFDEIMIKKLA